MTNTARLNLTTGAWSTLGSGVNGAVHALTISGNVLYAGGGFTQAGGNAASSVAQWNIDTNTWSALSTGPYTGTTYALAMNGAELIAGGSYTNDDGTSVYRWDGSWHAMGTGTYVHRPCAQREQSRPLCGGLRLRGYCAGTQAAATGYRSALI